MKIKIFSTYGETLEPYIEIIERHAKIISVNYSEYNENAERLIEVVKKYRYINLKQTNDIDECFIEIEIQNDICTLFKLYDDLKKYNKGFLFEGLLLYKNQSDELCIEIYDFYRE
jgi:hypothetical protein